MLEAHEKLNASLEKWLEDTQKAVRKKPGEVTGIAARESGD